MKEVMNMLKKWIAAAVCSVALALAVSLWAVPSVRAARAPAGSSPEPETSAQSARYRVAVYNGYVAVFAGEASEPFRVLETPLSALPEGDRKLLEAGISVDSDAELQRLLEDYS